MKIKIVENLAEKNPCYKAGVKITPKGCMLHSVGVPQPDPRVFVKNWQSSSAKVCVHAVVGKDAVAYQLLPWNMRAWHCGSGPKGSGNNTLVSLEMTEPASIRYVGGSNWIELGNGANTKSHVLATYANAVQFFAYICSQYKLDPESSGALMSHHEGNLNGIASSHGDVEHIWNRFGLTMDQFREDVKKAMRGETVTTVPSEPVDTSSDDTSKQPIQALGGKVTVIYTKEDGICIRRAPSITAKVDQIVHGGTFTVTGISSDEKWYKLKSGLFITTIPDYVKFQAAEGDKESTTGMGYYRVRVSWDKADSQIGAFKKKENAIDLCRQNGGYKVYDNSGKEVYPLLSGIPANASFQFRVTVSDLKIRKGPGTTYDYYRQGEKPQYTGKGVFTIVMTKSGQGAKLWGLLEAYKDKENGWIALDEIFGEKAD